MLPANRQTCPTCGKENTIGQSEWKACCLLNFDFGYRTIGLRATPIFGVYLALQRYSETQGSIVISPGCLTEGELIFQIDALIDNLKELKKTSRKLFAKMPLLYVVPESQ